MESARIELLRNIVRFTEAAIQYVNTCSEFSPGAPIEMVYCSEKLGELIGASVLIFIKLRDFTVSCCRNPDPYVSVFVRNRLGHSVRVVCSDPKKEARIFMMYERCETKDLKLPRWDDD